MKNNQTTPKGWQIEKFGKHIKLEYGFSLPDRKREEGNFPVFGSSGIVGNHKEYLVKGPGIIVGRKGTIGSVIWSEKDFCPIDTTYYTEIDSSVYLRWLYYELQFLKLEKMNTASGVPGLNREEVYKRSVLFPPKPEQEKIAEILGAVDEDIEKTEKLIEETETLKRGLMQDLLNKPYLNQKNGIPISKICEINPEQVDPRKEDKIYNYVDIASIREHNIIDCKEFTGKDAPSRARRLARVNDIIISTVRPNLKAVSFISDREDKYLVSTGFCVLRCNPKEIDWRFIYQVSLTDEFSDYLISKTKGSNYPAVNSSDVGSYLINIPSLDVQKQISDILFSIDDKININKQLKAKLTELKKGLLSDLLSGEVRIIA